MQTANLPPLVRTCYELIEQHGGQFRADEQEWRTIRQIDGYTEVRFNKARKVALQLYGWNNNKPINY